MKLFEETVKETMVYDGKIIKVRNDDARIMDGTLVKREVVVHPGGVGIALEDKDGTFFMVKQYRYGQSEVLLEFPAGKKEPGEDPFDTAQREIVEETGYSGKDWVYLGHMAPTPAYDTEKIELYYAKADQFIGQHFDDDENIICEKHTIDELVNMIMNKEISDAKTIGMTFMVKEYKSRQR